MSVGVADYIVKIRGAPPVKVAECVAELLAAPRAYFLGQVFYLPEVQALLQHPTYAHLAHALHIMCFGVYSDVLAGRPEVRTFFEKSPETLKKIRQLTILSHCFTTHSPRFTDTMASTGVTEQRELDDLFIDMVADGIVQGRIDQERGTFEIRAAEARDVKNYAEDVDAMMRSIGEWIDRCDHELELLESVERDAKNDQEVKQDRLALKKERHDEAVKRCTQLLFEELRDPGDPIDPFQRGAMRRSFRSTFR